jgi:hypothetical protein
MEADGELTNDEKESLKEKHDEIKELIKAEKNDEETRPEQEGPEDTID